MIGLLLDCANSLLEWYMFMGINPVRGNQVGISECLITQLGLVSIC